MRRPSAGLAPGPDDHLGLVGLFGPLMDRLVDALRMVLQHGLGISPAGRARDLVTMGLQRSHQGLAQLAVVFNQQDVQAHGASGADAGCA